MSVLVDWERIKSEVDLEQYFLFKQGASFQFDKYKRAYVQNTESKHGDIIRFFNHERTGVKMYYSIVHNDSGDIIQFIKKRILQKLDASAEEINEELRQFVGISAFKVENKSLLNRKNNGESVLERDKFSIHGDIIPNIDVHLPYLLNFRKLSQKLIDLPFFSPVFFNYKTGNNDSLAFYIKDILGNIVGINRVQTADNEFFNKKWFEKNSNNGIGFTFSLCTNNSEILSIFETIFDAMSYQELFGEKSIQYMCSNGELGFKKSGLIKGYYSQNNFTKLYLGNDNDLAGVFFNISIISAFISEIVSLKKSKSEIIIEILEVGEERTIKMFKQFFIKSEKNTGNNAITSKHQTYFTETLSQNKQLYYFVISNSKDAINFNIDLLLRIWDLHFISIRTPVLKDFNEDLIALKTKNNG